MAAGQFCIAFVDKGVAFNAAVHNVVDADTFAFSLEGNEGDFPALELIITNPKVGILNPARKRWVWFSYDNGVTKVPLFYGRVVGVPNDIQKEDVTLSYIAKPDDYDEQRAALAADVRAAGRPTWDPIWFDPEKRDNPDNVLEAIAGLWHVDRVTHEVTISNIIDGSGEDGTVTFTDDEVFYDNMSITYGETPLRSVRMTASVSWDMDAYAEFNISDKFGFGAFGVIYTFTGPGLIERWPKSGASLGNGWRVKYGNAERIDGQGPAVYYTNQGDFPSTVDYPFTYRVPNSGGAPVTFTHNFEYAPKFFVPLYLKDWLQTGAGRIAVILRVPRWRVKPTMIVEYDVSRKYGETIVMELGADVQDLLTDPEDTDRLELSMSSSEIATPCDPGGVLPIGDVRRRSYFAQDRGEHSIEYLISIMRARLLARARAVLIEFEIPFARFIADGISCAMQAGFTDSRIPGTILGKIVAYSLKLDGGTGALVAMVTIACTIGKGGTVSASEGTPTYVNDCLEPGIQRYTDQFIMPHTGEVAYKSINGQIPNDDGLDLLTLSKDTIIKSLVKTNTWQAQEAAMANDPTNGPDAYGSDGDPRDIFARLDPVPTKFDLTMKPVTGGPFETLYSVELTELKIPMTIDTEAAGV